MRAQKLKAMIAKGQAAPSIEEVEVGEAEYAELLEESLPCRRLQKGAIWSAWSGHSCAEMEALMRANAKVGDDDLLALARARAQVVRIGWRARGVPGGASSCSEAEGGGARRGRRGAVLATLIGRGNPDLRRSYGRCPGVTPSRRGGFPRACVSSACDVFSTLDAFSPARRFRRSDASPRTPQERRKTPRTTQVTMP